MQFDCILTRQSKYDFRNLSFMHNPTSGTQQDQNTDMAESEEVLVVAKYVVLSKTYASPPFIQSPLFSCILYPMQLQMVIFEEGTGPEHVAMLTSKCEPSGIFCRVQHPCQVSIALLHYWRSYS